MDLVCVDFNMLLCYVIFDKSVIGISYFVRTARNNILVSILFHIFSIVGESHMVIVIYEIHERVCDTI